MPDGTPGRPASDTQQLLKLMSMRSEIVELRLAVAPESNRPAIEELPPAAASVLDQLVQARVRSEEQALAMDFGEDAPTGLAAPLFAEPVPKEEASAPAQRMSTLEPEEWVAEEEELFILAAEDEPAVDLLELNAAEAGQPVEIQPLDLPSFDAPAAAEQTAPQPSVEQTIEPDELLAQPLESIEEGVIPVEYQLPGEEDVPPEHSEEGQLAGLETIEELPEAAQLEPEGDLGEGPGEDFQALLFGARQPEAEPGPRQAAASDDDDDDVPLLPADGDVKLRARNGPKPGAEFVGKSTLASAGGLYCLIERFNLPVGTRMKVTLTAPRFTERFDIDDAVVKRVRRAPANTTEVQLSFEQRHEDFEEFVTQHFGDKPVGFSLFTRRRPPKR